MGSQVAHVMGFLPVNSQLATPFHSRLQGQARDRMTDGQTDRRWPSIHYASTLRGRCI